MLQLLVRVRGVLASSLTVMVVAASATLLPAATVRAYASSAATPDDPSADLVAPATARAELRFVADTVVRVHPSMTDPQARSALERALDAQSAALGDAPTKGAVAVAVQRLLASLGDAHTTAAPQVATDRFLPVAFFATSDGILVSPVAGAPSLPRVGRLLRLGALTPDEVLARLAGLIPGNAAWVRYHGMQMLNSAPVLGWLGVLAGGAVEVVSQGPDGRIHGARVALAPAKELQGRSSPLQAMLQRAIGLGEPWTGSGQTYRWRIDEASGTGVFWLLSCVDSPEYRQAVDAFFRAVDASELRRVVLDVQFDGGGNSAVVDAWLAHLPARNVRMYGVRERLSKPVMEQRGAASLAAGLLPKQDGLTVMQRAGSARVVLPSEPVFRGEMTVLVNGATFSSAGMIATILSDNGLARVAGEPMGAEPSSFGDILSFRTPALGLPFTVSYKSFDRPLTDRGPSALPLDVPLPLTVNDVLDGRDVLAAWLGSLTP